MEWDAKKYNTSHDFIFKYGANLFEWLPKEPKRILDIGCGTGQLTKQMADLGHEVTGIDQSASMIAQAQASFPKLTFLQENILKPSDQLAEYDIAFSNAVFHWILNQDLLLKQIYHRLVPYGELVCEFGADGNVALIRTAFGEELQTLGYEFQEPFCFTPAAEYRRLLISNHFEVLVIQEYDRPTPLKSGAEGLRVWLQQFYPTELNRLTAGQKEQLLHNVEQKLAPKLWHQDHWEADYRRLKIRARKLH
ncbi:methyltransferase domain-containing protein [Erwinia sp. CPCC 100877]|nr:methyltransferase domain-containing protein [Erwinia sp. CPCC 100877]